MAKKSIKVMPVIQTQMGTTWDIEVRPTPFFDEKGGNLPSFGYPCAACGNQGTKLRFAESSEEEESNLLWLTLHCRTCGAYTKYTRKSI